MNTLFALKILFEIGLIFAIAYGYKHEDELVEFEQELYIVLRQYVRKKLRGARK